jgi:hypothetical protein
VVKINTVRCCFKLTERDLSIRPTFHPDYIASGDYFQ